MLKLRVLNFILVGLLLSQYHLGTAQIHPLGPPQRITPTGREFLQPIWSPSGEWIAITGPQYNGIWVIRPNASGLQQLTADFAVGYKMKWSPDGKSLLGRMAKFEKRRRYHAVKIYDVATKKGILLSDFRTLMPGLPEWAVGNWRVVLFANRGMEFFEIPGKKTDDAKMTMERPLVFTGQQGLIVGSTMRATTKTLEPVKGQVINAALSPDGSKIVFEMAAGNLYVCKIDGSGLIDLGRGERPQWSPDGNKIAYMISTDDGHRILNADIYVIRSDGTGKINLTNSKDRIEMNCTWSPDGKHLAFDERNSGGVWVMELRE